MLIYLFKPKLPDKYYFVIMKKLISIINKKEWKLDLFFIASIFIIPLILKFLVDFNDVTVKTIMIAFWGLWGILKVGYSKLELEQLNLFDIGIFTITIYTLCNFYFLSEATVYYYKLWLYLGYIFLFFIFRWVLKTKEETKLIHLVFFIIVGICFIEALLASLQYLNVINSRNNYFKLLGSFNSPNFFAAFIGLGFIILMWFFFVKKTQNNTLKIIGSLLLLLFSTLIIASKSRGTWLSITGSTLILLSSFNYSRKLLKKISLIKITLLLLTLISTIIISSKLLYNLKPDSVDGRSLITKISLQEIVKHPLKGHGLFSFARKYNAAKATYFSESPKSWEEIKHATYVFSAFNEYVLISFELGLIILSILIVLIALVILRIKYTHESRLGLCLFTYLCIWGLFNSPSESLAIMTIGIFSFALLFKDTSLKKIRASKNFDIILKVFIVSVGLLCIYSCSNKIIKTKKYQHYTSIKTKQDIKELIYLSKFTEDNSFSDAYLGTKLYNNGFTEKGFHFIHRAFKKSAAPRIGKRLALINTENKKYKSAEEIYKFNINVEPYRYEARMDLLNLYIKLNRRNDIIKLSNEIINFPVKIPSSQIDIYKKTASDYLKKYNSISNNKLNGSLSNE